MGSSEVTKAFQNLINSSKEDLEKNRKAFEEIVASYNKVLKQESEYVSAFSKKALDEFIEYLEDIDVDTVNKGFSEISDEIATRLANGNKNSLNVTSMLPAE